MILRLEMTGTVASHISSLLAFQAHLSICRTTCSIQTTLIRTSRVAVIHLISLIPIPSIILQEAIPSPSLNWHSQVGIIRDSSARRSRASGIPLIAFIKTVLERIHCDLSAQIGHCDVVGVGVVRWMADLVLSETLLNVRCSGL